MSLLVQYTVIHVVRYSVHCGNNVCFLKIITDVFFTEFITVFCPLKLVLYCTDINNKHYPQRSSSFYIVFNCCVFTDIPQLVHHSI